MSDHNKDDLHSFLFDEGRELVNIKFLLGDDPNLTIQQVRDASAKALRSAMSKGPVHSPPTTGRPKGVLAPLGE